MTEALSVNVNEGLASKADLLLAVSDLKAEIAGLRSELKTEIAELETRLTAKGATVETTIANTRAELIRWIVTSFVGNVITMVTIAIAVAKFVAHP